MNNAANYLFRLFILSVSFINAAYADNELPTQEPQKDLPIEVRLALNINKIYAINPVDESFNIDAYLGIDWIDKRAGELITNSDDHITLEDEQVDQWRDKIWNPSLEIINTMGPKNISNKRIIIYKDGRVFYNERFTAVLHSSMNFRTFPFDTQELRIIIEPFSYAASRLTFSGFSRVYPSENSAWPMLEWSVINRACQIADQNYEYLSDSTAEKKFTQFSFAVTVKRIPGYFILQILLPLSVIMLCAWSVFFVKDGATQLSLISTLMLTVCAFNFFITDSLPKLPYSTFLGKIIIISFIAIFLQLICHLIEHNANREFSKRENTLLAFMFVVFFSLANGVSWLFSTAAIPQNEEPLIQNNIRSCVQ